MANKLKLTITGGEDQGSEIELDLFTSLLVGRSRKSDIRLHDADVSGRHFEFVRGTSGVSVKDLSRNGLKVDGKVVGEGEIVPVRAGSVIEVGAEAKLTVGELPGVTEEGAAAEALPATNAVEQATGAEDFFGAEAERTESVVTAADSASGTASNVPESETHGETMTHGDFEDALTEAGEGETQEMKTRVGSMEEIYARKRQLDRASAIRRWKFGSVIVGVMLVLAAFWFVTGSRRHVSDAEGPFIPGTDQPDIAEWELLNDSGDVELVLEYPRDDRMKVTVPSDSNGVDVVTFLGIDRDVPFHLEFKRWSDPTELRLSLEDSFARRIGIDTASGMSFEVQGGVRPVAEFFDGVFPGYCEQTTQRGVRFVRARFTRSSHHELWHGVVLYMRTGDRVYQLRTEIPDVYWRRGGYRLTDEPHLAMPMVFSKNHWESPGAAGLVDDKFSDDYLLQVVKGELAASRVAAWPIVESYVNTLLVRTWGEKPVLQKLALAHYKTLLEQMKRFYNERLLAFKVARENADDKKMKSVFIDAKTVFGAMPQDRRSTLVYDPEVWSCRQGR